MEAILTRSVGGVGRVTLNRPEQRNALAPEHMALLGQALRALDADPDVRCILLDGAGEHFVAGGDLSVWSRLIPLPPQERGEDFRAQFAEVFPLVEALEALTKPLVVAVKGYAVGAGLCFVLAADFVIADETAKFIFANIRVGISPDLALTYYLPRVVGERRALRMSLLGSQLNVQEAKDLGIVDEVAPAGDIEAALDNLIRKLLATPVRAAAETKRLIRVSARNTLTAQFWEEADGVVACAQDDDFIEAATAFAERRQPRFGQGARGAAGAVGPSSRVPS
jgi:2-(1,2-epoxy-1,2-dihydrophenyl)acetyl-CoA isomerase